MVLTEKSVLQNFQLLSSLLLEAANLGEKACEDTVRRVWEYLVPQLSHYEETREPTSLRAVQSRFNEQTYYMGDQMYFLYRGKTAIRIASHQCATELTERLLDEYVVIIDHANGDWFLHDHFRTVIKWGENEHWTTVFNLTEIEVDNNNMPDEDYTFMNLTVHEGVFFHGIYCQWYLVAANVIDATGKLLRTISRLPEWEWTRAKYFNDPDITANTALYSAAIGPDPRILLYNPNKGEYRPVIPSVRLEFSGLVDLELVYGESQKRVEAVYVRSRSQLYPVRGHCEMPCICDENGILHSLQKTHKAITCAPVYHHGDKPAPVYALPELPADYYDSMYDML